MRRDPEEIRRALGDALRELRSEQGLTQEALADRAGLHAHYISDIERGLRNVAVVNLSYIGEALGMSASELLGRATL